MTNNKIMKLMKKAEICARTMGHVYIGTEHVLIAYYAEYNPELAIKLINQVKKEIGYGLYFYGTLRTTSDLDSIEKSSNSIFELIFNILIDEKNMGRIFLLQALS